MGDALAAIAIFGWAPFLSLVVGVLYFASSNTTAPPTLRALTSAYAPCAAMIFLSIAFSPASFRTSYLPAVYPVLMFIPVGLLALSLLRYPGPRWAHFVLIPMALVCIAWQAAWSYWGIYGK